ncbi:DUF5916 domain-containing protein [Rhodoflexus sp.]
MKKIFTILLFSTFVQEYAIAQEVFKPDSIRKKVVAVRTEASLKIDGHLDEAAWQTALPVSHFVQVEPFQGQPAGFDTEVRILYNHEYLYIAAFCRDSLGRKAIRVPDLRRDFDSEEQDVFGIVIDGFNDKRNAMAFMANPYGSQRDLLGFDDMMFDTDWDGRWKVRTHRLDSGWVAEFAIPWQTLRYPAPVAGKEVVWGINFVRNRRASNELTGWSPYPRAFSVFRMEYAGELTGIQPPPPAPNVQVIPYVLQTVDRYPFAANSSERVQSISKVGGDVKWAINSNSVLDLTINTDFAQADADRQVNNLTRFSVFFPERRQFFLENASLFGAGLAPEDNLVGGAMRIQPFFSRRIGLDAVGNPLPIVAGARYVYRSVQRNYGGILMRQGGDATHAPITYAVGRYSQNLGKQNRAGALITYRDEEGMNGRPSSRNMVAAADAFFRFSQSLNLNTMVIKSIDTDSTGNGFAGFAQFRYNSNNLVAWLTQSVVTANFNPKTGFVSRNNVIATTPGFFFIVRKPWIPKFIRGIEPGIFSEVYFNAQTRALQEARVSFNPLWIALQSGGFMGVFIDPTFQRLEDTFSPVSIDIHPGDYRYLRGSIMAGSDRSKKISYFASTAFGGYYDGRLWTISGNVRLAPDPHFQMNFSYENNQFRGVGINQEDVNVHLWSIESRMAVNPRLQLIGFYQFNSSANRDIWNVRMSWEFRPLSFVYLVFNQRGFDTINERQKSQHLIGKVTYLKQF